MVKSIFADWYMRIILKNSDKKFSCLSIDARSSILCFVNYGGKICIV